MVLWEVFEVSGDQEVGGGRERDLQEQAVRYVRQSDVKGIGCVDFCRRHDVLHQQINARRFDIELASTQHLIVFEEDSSVHAENKSTGGEHADEFSARAEWRKEPGHEDVRVQHDPHRARSEVARRTSAISASISSIEIRSVPF